MKWKEIEVDYIDSRISEMGAIKAIAHPRNGAVGYYVDGKLHREDGPAIIHKNGATFYWYRGVHHEDISSDDVWIKLCKMKSFW